MSKNRQEKYREKKQSKVETTKILKGEDESEYKVDFLVFSGEQAEKDFYYRLEQLSELFKVRLVVPSPTIDGKQRKFPPTDAGREARIFYMVAKWLEKRYRGGGANKVQRMVKTATKMSSEEKKALIEQLKASME